MPPPLADHNHQGAGKGLAAGGIHIGQPVPPQPVSRDRVEITIEGPATLRRDETDRARQRQVVQRRPVDVKAVGIHLHRSRPLQGDMPPYEAANAEVKQFDRCGRPDRQERGVRQHDRQRAATVVLPDKGSRVGRDIGDREGDETHHDLPHLARSHIAPDRGQVVPDQRVAEDRVGRRERGRVGQVVWVEEIGELQHGHGAYTGVGEAEGKGHHVAHLRRRAVGVGDLLDHLHADGAEGQVDPCRICRRAAGAVKDGQAGGYRAGRGQPQGAAVEGAGGHGRGKGRRDHPGAAKGPDIGEQVAIAVLGVPLEDLVVQGTGIRVAEQHQGCRGRGVHTRRDGDTGRLQAHSIAHLQRRRDGSALVGGQSETACRRGRCVDRLPIVVERPEKVQRVAITVVGRSNVGNHPGAGLWLGKNRGRDGRGQVDVQRRQEGHGVGTRPIARRQRRGHDPAEAGRGGVHAIWRPTRAHRLPVLVKGPQVVQGVVVTVIDRGIVGETAGRARIGRTQRRRLNLRRQVHRNGRFHRDRVGAEAVAGRKRRRNHPAEAGRRRVHPRRLRARTHGNAVLVERPQVGQRVAIAIGHRRRIGNRRCTPVGLSQGRRFDLGRLVHVESGAGGVVTALAIGDQHRHRVPAAGGDDARRGQAVGIGDGVAVDHGVGPKQGPAVVVEVPGEGEDFAERLVEERVAVLVAVGGRVLITHAHIAGRRYDADTGYRRFVDVNRAHIGEDTTHTVAHHQAHGIVPAPGIGVAGGDERRVGHAGAPGAIGIVPGPGVGGRTGDMADGRHVQVAGPTGDDRGYARTVDEEGATARVVAPIAFTDRRQSGPVGVKATTELAGQKGPGKDQRVAHRHRAVHMAGQDVGLLLGQAGVHGYRNPQGRADRDRPVVRAVILVVHGDRDGAHRGRGTGAKDRVDRGDRQVGNQRRRAVPRGIGRVHALDSGVGAIAGSPAEGQAGRGVAVGCATAPVGAHRDSAVGLVTAVGDAARIPVGGGYGKDARCAGGQVGDFPVDVLVRGRAVAIVAVGRRGGDEIEGGGQLRADADSLGVGRGACVADRDRPHHQVAAGEVGGGGRDGNAQERPADVERVAGVQGVIVATAVLITARQHQGSRCGAVQVHGEGKDREFPRGESRDGIEERAAHRPGDAQVDVAGHAGAVVGHRHGDDPGVGAGGHRLRGDERNHARRSADDIVGSSGDMGLVEALDRPHRSAAPGGLDLVQHAGAGGDDSCRHRQHLGTQHSTQGPTQHLAVLGIARAGVDQGQSGPQRIGYPDHRGHHAGGIGHIDGPIHFIAAVIRARRGLDLGYLQCGLVHPHQVRTGLAQVVIAAQVYVTGTNRDRPSGKGTTDVHHEAHPDGLLRVEAGQVGYLAIGPGQGIARRTRARGIAAGNPAPGRRGRPGPDDVLGRSGDIFQTCRQFLVDGRRIDTEQPPIAYRSGDHAIGAGVDRPQKVGVDQDGRRQFDVRHRRRRLQTTFPQAPLVQAEAVGQIVAADHLGHEGNRDPLLGLNHREGPSDPVGGGHHRRSGSGAHRGGNVRGKVAQVAAEHIVQGHVVARPGARVEDDQRPGDHVGVGKDHFGKLGHKRMAGVDRRRGQRPARGALGLAAGVAIVDRCLERRYRAAAHLHAHAHRRRRGRRETVRVGPAVAQGVRLGGDRRHPAEAQDLQDVVGRRGHFQVDIVGGGLGGTAQRQGKGILPTGRDRVGQFRKGNLHRRRLLGHKDALLQDAVVGALAVPGHSQVDVGPVVELEIGAGRWFGDGRLVTDPHGCPGHGDGADGGDVGNDQRCRGEEGKGCRTGRGAVGNADDGGARYVTLERQDIGKDDAAPGGGHDKGAVEGVGIGVGICRVGAGRHGGGNRLVRTDARRIALDVGGGMGRGGLDAVAAVPAGGGDDVGDPGAALVAAAGLRVGRGRAKDRVEGNGCRSGHRPGDVGVHADGKGSASGGIQDGPAGRHLVGDDDGAADAAGAGVDRGRHALPQVDLGGHGLLNAESGRDGDQRPVRPLGNFQVGVVATVIVVDIEVEMPPVRHRAGAGDGQG